MNKKNRMLLQLFAQGGDSGQGGEGVLSGENGADAGHNNRLLELGVPAEKLSRANTGTTAGSQAAAGETTEAPARRLTWEEIKQDPEYNREMQNMVRSRLKAASQAWEKRLAESQPTATQPDLRQHYDGLLRQAEGLRQTFPDFDLQRELKNPEFVRLTAPHVGLSVEDAYYTLHRKELQAAAMQFSAQATAQRISSAIQSGSRRPQENGTGSHAPSITTFDYRNASREQREALKQQIRLAAARGEKLYPGKI